LVVYGATPGGVACAVRAAREELDVVLVSHTEHVGGMLTSGLSTMDTLYNGARAPIYDELRRGILEHYAKTYGKGSPQYQAAQPGHPKSRYEAHVVERLINQLLNAESRITTINGYYPVSVKRRGALIASVTFRQTDGDESLTLAASAFADCSYEADLAAAAGVRYRVGREARQEFQEPHAGIIFMRKTPWPPAHVDAAEFAYSRRLNLYQYDAWYETIAEASTGKADPAVQGFNMRTIITNDPNNRVPIEKPKDFDPERFRKFGFGNPQRPGLTMPNQKFGMNEPKLVGEQNPYVEGDWKTRRAVADRHRDAALGLLYFRQTNPSVPQALREEWQKVGLPKDEFADNGHTPYEVYARETRRIVGRAVFSEHDARLAPKLKRAPVHADAVSITEWFLDSHACTPRSVEGSELEGMVMLKNQTFPGQVSYQTLLPKEFDNLVVPVCLSATHVGWGTIRLEPTWMSIGEAAACALALAKQRGVPASQVDSVALSRLLAERRVMLSFFNDIEGKENESWYPAIQFLGTQGYFATYDALPAEPLRKPLADSWLDLSRNRWQGKHSDPTTIAQSIHKAEQQQGPTVTAQDFAQRLADALPAQQHPSTSPAQFLAELQIPTDKPLTRATTCRLIFVIEMARSGANQ
jgi:hypothetical protein